MKYISPDQELGLFYSNKHLKQTDEAFSCSKEDITKNSLEISVTEWKTTTLKAHLIHTVATKDVQIFGGVDENFVLLHFVCQGETHLESTLFPPLIKKNENGFFFCQTNNIKHLFKKGQHNVCFRVFLPYDYIETKAMQYPEVFETLSTMIKKRCPMLRNKLLSTTLEMQSVIEQIMDAPHMGTSASFYFETKIHELLVLQLQQIKKIDCLNCKSLNRHYEEQLNQVRNLIENCYQNPPSIKQIANQVGMSETVLKTNFKSYFGTTIYGYLFDYRMSMAKQLLPDNSMTIAEIGYEIGYEYPSHFTTAFKRKYGISPTEYKNKHV